MSRMSGHCSRVPNIAPSLVALEEEGQDSMSSRGRSLNDADLHKLSVHPSSHSRDCVLRSAGHSVRR